MSDPDLRFDHILTELNRKGSVSVQQLANNFHVSRETIRRDLKELEKAGHLRCVYGGGVKPQPGGDEPIAARMRVNAREKARIGVEAAKLLPGSAKIFIDAGTTTLAFAKHLKEFPEISVYTNSLDVAELLCGFGHPNVFSVGGRVSSKYRAFMGADSLMFVSQHLFDIAFISTAAIDSRLGFMDLGEEEANLRRLLRRQSRQCVMLADSSKFGRQGSICTCQPKDIDILVTDSALKPDFLEFFALTPMRVHYAQ
jgi:DeoR/GlpR family transcriptional regulator of sugar metabolism